MKPSLHKYLPEVLEIRLYNVCSLAVLNIPTYTTTSQPPQCEIYISSINMAPIRVLPINSTPSILSLAPADPGKSSSVVPFTARTHCTAAFELERMPLCEKCPYTSITGHTFPCASSCAVWFPFVVGGLPKA